MGKRELAALLSFPSWCLVMVVWLFLAVPWVCHCGISSSYSLFLADDSSLLNHKACPVIQHAFTKLSLVNQISKFNDLPKS